MRSQYQRRNRHRHCPCTNTDGNLSIRARLRMISSRVSTEVTFGRGDLSEGGMIRLETLIELKFLNSSFLSLSSDTELVQTIPRREIRGKSSDSRQQYLSQQYPPPLLDVTFGRCDLSFCPLGALYRGPGVSCF